jgi:hypothetical protein
MRDLPGGDIEGGVQVDDPVSVVVVRMAHCPPRAQRSRILCAFERLNGGLFVDAQHDGVLRRVQVEPHERGRSVLFTSRSSRLWTRSVSAQSGARARRCAGPRASGSRTQSAAITAPPAPEQGPVLVRVQALFRLVRWGPGEPSARDGADLDPFAGVHGERNKRDIVCAT